MGGQGRPKVSANGRQEWLKELGQPSGRFFAAYAARVRAEGGAIAAAQEAVTLLTPAVDWPAYLPHIPHGLLGLQGVFRLRPLLAESSFLRVLGTQLHAFAVEARSPAGHGLGAIGQGSGNWANLTMALDSHRSSIAWGEALGLAEPSAADFRRLESRAEPDMANVGHKAVTARALGELNAALGARPEAGRPLLALCAWLCASEPFDTFWHDRAGHRLGGAVPVPFRPAQADPAELAAGVREICDSGLVDLLDGFAGRVRAGTGSGDLLATLVLAAAEKQLDARRDLEGKTAWNFVFLATLAKRVAETGQGAPESWVQAAALVNLFPTGEEEERPRPSPPRMPGLGDGEGLLDAILDGDAQPAMFLAKELLAGAGPDRLLQVLAEAASGNDPAFNHCHQLLAVAAAADLAPLLPAPVLAVMLVALAKFLGNCQGSSDLGRLADAALKGTPGSS